MSSKFISKGFSAGKWVSIARYIVDAAKVGHSGTKIVEIAEKMRYVRWSRVEKSDLTKIQDQKLFNIVRDQYKASSTIGNGSSADALRYEKVTGILLSPAGHQKKNTEVRDSLLKRLNAGEFMGNDIVVARNIINDLTNSLNGN